MIPCRRHGEAFFELHIVVLPRVWSGGCSLDIDLAARKGERLAWLERIHILPGYGLFVALVLWKLRRVKDHVRQVVGQFRYHDLPIGIVDVIVVVAVKHEAAILGVRDPVLQHLHTCQVIVINSDAVKVYGAVTPANRDIDRGCLRKIVIRWILHHSRWNPVDIHKEQPVR